MPGAPIFAQPIAAPGGSAGGWTPTGPDQGVYGKSAILKAAQMDKVVTELKDILEKSRKL